MVPVSWAIFCVGYIIHESNKVYPRKPIHYIHTNYKIDLYSRDQVPRLNIITRSIGVQNGHPTRETISPEMK